MIMLYRKITSYIVDYLKSVNDKILILEGARQIGKAFSIRSLLNLKCKNTKSEEIIEEIKKQSKDTILKYLKKRCADSRGQHKRWSLGCDKKISIKFGN